MNKFWKIIGWGTLCIIIFVYGAFLFLIPNIIDVNQYKIDIQKLVQEQSGLNIDFENAKIITTPLLGAGFKADNISIKLPDNSLLFSADNIKTRISIPSLLLLTVKISCFEVDKPFVNLEIANNENFKVLKLAEDLLNQGKEQRLEQPANPVETKDKSFQLNPEWIRIKIPNVKLNNYKILVNDLKSKHYLDLHGEELTLGYFNGKTAKVKTYAEIFSDDKKNITVSVNIDTVLPKPSPKLDEEDDKAERIDIPFVNPVSMYRNYDLKANLDTKLRIRAHENNITSYGYFNVDNFTVTVGKLQLPKSYFHAKTFGKNINLDTDIYPVKNQNIKILGNVNYGHHSKMNMSIKTANIQFNDLVILAKAFLDSLQIKNELALIKAEGSLKADCNIKTNFKKLTSNGYINVENGGISVRNLGKVLSKANINIKFDEDTVDIRNSCLNISNAPLKIDGKIDKKSNADINVKADAIPLPVLFKAFAPKEIRNAYNFKSGNLTLDLGIHGQLKKAAASAKFDLSNLNISDNTNNFVILNNKFVGEFLCNTKLLRGTINNKDLSINFPKTRSNIMLPLFSTEISDNNIVIKENSILLNNKTKINYLGEIIDYNKLKSINFIAHGNLNTDDLVKFLGADLKPFIHSSGEIPIKLTVEGNKQKQTIFMQALADSANLITPIDIRELQNRNTSLQAVIDLKPNRIKIKKTGLFIRTVNVDEKGNEIIHLDEVAGIDGTVEGNRINLFKITLPKELHGKICIFPQSNFSLKGKAFVFGETSLPRMRGGFTLSNLSIPELFTTVKTADLRFKGHHANIDIQDVLLIGSDVNITTSISMLPDAITNILNLDINSRYINLDKLMKVSEQAIKYLPQGNSTGNQNSTPDIPIVVHNGSIRLHRIITGNIDIQNTTSNLTLRKNILYLNNLRSHIFNGSARGNISVNLITTLLRINMKGENINVEKALLDGCAMKDTLSGIAKFDANISLQGVTMEEQMQSLKGIVDFTVKDGQFGPFGKLENLIIAENIRESQFFQTALGGIISGLTTIDTTHFSDLSGTISFNNGICHLDPVTSLGNILSLHIFGDFDLLRNYADMKVRARMASLVSNLLGPIGAINPANLINSAASLNVVTAKAFSIFCEMIPENELTTLPSFSNKYIDNSATKFQLVIRGDVAKPLTLVKSFKWLASQTDYQNAVDYVNSLPEPIEGSEATNIEEMVKEVEAEHNSLKYKFKHLFNNSKNKTDMENSTHIEQTDIEEELEAE